MVGRIALLLLLAAAPAAFAPPAAAGACALGAGDHLDQTLSSGGLQRLYDVFVPGGCDPNEPFALVLDFHGGLSNKAAHRAVSGFRGLAEQEGFVLVQPEGTGADLPGQDIWNIGFDLLGELTPQSYTEPDDVAFVRELVAEVSALLPIDAARVYATGHSMGGGMTHLLGCRAADLFRAIAPVSFWLVAEQELACAPSQPIPIRAYHGYFDAVVCYDVFVTVGAITTVCPPGNARSTAPASFVRWAGLQGCTDTPQTTFGLFGSALSEHTECSGGSRVGTWALSTFYDPVDPFGSGLAAHLPYANIGGVDIAGDAWAFFESVPEPGAALSASASAAALFALRALRRRRGRA